MKSIKCTVSACAVDFGGIRGDVIEARAFFWRYNLDFLLELFCDAKPTTEEAAIRDSGVDRPEFIVASDVERSRLCVISFSAKD